MALLEVCTVAGGLLLLVVLLHYLFRPSQRTGAAPRKVLVVAQAVPPMVKIGAGVSKRYLSVCRALISKGWEVSLLTPIDVLKDAEMGQWVREGKLRFVRARGVQLRCPDGFAVFMDLCSFWTMFHMLKELVWHGGYDVVVSDDVPMRLLMLLLLRALGVPNVTTSHTDATHLASYQQGGFVLHRTWELHMMAAHVADLHATVSNQFADIIRSRYNVPVQAVWPAILWSPEFRLPIADFAAEAAELRASWESSLGFKPKALFMYAGRWAREKRIPLLCNSIPDDCALVIVGDGASKHADHLVQEFGHVKNIHFARKMLGAHDLRVAYAASDVFVSASNFETLGNTVVESLASGTAVALQPAQGHLEFCKEGLNGFFVDYEKPDEARARLQQIADGQLWRPEHLPELLSAGEAFRTSNFADDFIRTIITPAIQRCHQRKAAIVESLQRLAAGLAFTVLWPVSRLLYRIGFMFFNALCTNYEFQIVPELGGCT